MTLIADNTADTTDLTDISFTSGIDNTYKLFVFKYYDINPATNLAEFNFNGSVDGGSNYNVIKTTTYFRAYHDEADGASALGYVTTFDLAQATGDQTLAQDVGNGADESCAGELFLFNPSNTTYVKHFYATTQTYNGHDYSYNEFVGGYFNTTDNIDAVIFKMSSGNMDGTIKMYGVG